MELKKLPPPGGKADAADMIMQGGGPIPNTMIGLARLGLKTAVIAGLGNDMAGQIGREELRSEKVSDRWIITKNRPSDVAAGFVEMGSGRRTIVLHRGMEVKPSDIKTSTLPEAKIIHLDGRDLEACIKLAKWGRKQGALISFDIGSVRNDVSPIFPLVDHLVVADSYALPFTKTRSPRRAIEKLRRHCKGTIVITLGMKGQLAFEDGKYYRQTPFRVDAVDTTGAGDAFHTGYLYALLEGATMQTRLIYGSAVAALKCLKMGARSGLPNKTELIRFLNKVQG